MFHMIEVRYVDGSAEFFDFSILGVAREFARDLTKAPHGIDCLFVTLKDGSVFKWDRDSKWIALDATWAI